MRFGLILYFCVNVFEGVDDFFGMFFRSFFGGLKIEFILLSSCVVLRWLCGFLLMMCLV